MERLKPTNGKIEVDAYFAPPTSISKFNEVPTNLFRKLKNGLRVWVKEGSARTLNYKKKILESDLDRDS